MRLAGVAVAAALSFGGAVGAQATGTFDVLDYDIRVNVRDSGAMLTADASLTVRRAGPPRVLSLDLIGMQVRGVRVRSRAGESIAPFTHDGRRLTITLPLQAGVEDTLRVDVRYDGRPSDGFVLSADSAGGSRGFADNWPSRARQWIPSIDRPDDKATVTWRVEAPADRTVIANGSLVGRTPTNGAGAPEDRSAHPERATTTWRESHPIPTYLMVIAVAPLERHDLVSCGAVEPNDGRCIAQAVFAEPDVRDFLPGPFARAPEMVSYFTGLFGPFPFEKLWHVQSSTRFGGMENASAIFYAGQPFRDRTMGEGVIAHETAHQWFGDAVTERTFGDLWLSEGFATYFAALWTGHAHGDSAFRAAMRASRAEVVGSAVTRARPLRDTAETDYMRLLNTNSYQKGGWVLHMLRGEIGDSAFFRGVRAYYAAHRDGNATTDDLRAAMESSSRRELRSFFDQWLTRPGIPAFTLVRVGRASATGDVIGDIGGDVTYDVRQTSPMPYAFRLTVAERAGGRRATVRVPARRFARVRLPPGALDIDPDAELLWAAP